MKFNVDDKVIVTKSIAGDLQESRNDKLKDLGIPNGIKDGL